MDGQLDRLVPVSLRALTLRINRTLAPEGRRLKPARGRDARRELGDFFLLDEGRNVVVEGQINPEVLGRALGVLSAWETVDQPRRSHPVRRSRVYLD